MKPIIVKAKNYLFRAPFVQKVCAHLAPTPSMSRWVFIVGCYNSGTTLLAKLLSEHSAVSTLPGEGVAFTDSLNRPEEFGWPRMWVRCENDMRVERSDEDVVARRVKRQWGCAAIGTGDNFLEKSIANASRIEFFEKHFQPAYFIHIVRNGYAVAEGIRRKAIPSKWGNLEYSDSYPISLCAKQWLHTEERLAQGKGKVKNILHVSYEELVSEPERILKNIFDYLGVEWEGGVNRNDVLVHGRKGPIVNMNGDSISRLSKDDIETIYDIAGTMLDRYGYTSG